MKPEKAIEDLEELTKLGPSFAWWHHTDALKLGIEALKRHQLLRGKFAMLGLESLPSETKD